MLAYPCSVLQRGCGEPAAWCRGERQVRQPHPRDQLFEVSAQLSLALWSPKDKLSQIIFERHIPKLPTIF